jgi:hypothetical protein
MAVLHSNLTGQAFYENRVSNEAPAVLTAATTSTTTQQPGMIHPGSSAFFCSCEILPVASNL